MNAEWKKRDRPCAPCVNCGAELYEKFWGNGGWAPTEKATDETYHADDCVRNLRETVQRLTRERDDARYSRDAAEAEVAQWRAAHDRSPAEGEVST